MADQFPSGRALIIGIANYPNVSKLPVAVLNDAREVAKFLQSPDYCGYVKDQVKLLLDGQATKDNIRRELQELARTAQQDDTVIVFFSGHGGRSSTDPDADTYLIPYNCDLAKLKDTAIESAELTAWMKAIKSERLVVLLDACHSAGAGDPKTALDPGNGVKAGLGPAVYDVLQSGAGRVVMSSSREDEVSFVLPGAKHSLFTQHLLDALKGGAALPGEKVIRVFPVFRYVSDAVPTVEPNQHPNFKALVENDFPLALNQGGKVASIPEPAATRSRPEELSFEAWKTLRVRLLNNDRCLELAKWFRVPLETRVTWPKGEEPIRLLDWLEAEGKQGDLRSIFVLLGWDQLVEVIDKNPT